MKYLFNYSYEIAKFDNREICNLEYWELCKWGIEMGSKQ